MNLVLYISDALRTDHVGCYGARRIDTRTIDALAAGGVRFDQAISAAPWTCPSMASMVTGVYPHRHGVLHWDARLDPSLGTLFTACRAAGYAVGSFVFDEDYLFRGFADANVVGTSEQLDGAMAWLREHRDGPFLLVFHSWATHMPYDVLHSERREWLAAKQEIIDGIQSDSAAALEALHEGYRRAVEHQSEVLLASFLEELEALGLTESTAVAFVADHGESWGERVRVKTEVQGTYHLHGSTLFDEIAEVPLILSAPGRLAPAVVTSQVRTVDVTPTLLDLAGTALDGTDGRSLVPLATGAETGHRPAVIAGTDRGALTQLALRLPPWKLLTRLDTGIEEAYDLVADPREQRSVPGQVPAELRAALYAELERVVATDLSAAEEALVETRLRDLGYL